MNQGENKRRNFNFENEAEDANFKPKYESLKDEDVVDPNIQHDKSFTEKILDQRYGKDAFVPNAKQEEYGKTPIWAEIFIRLVQFSFLYIIVVLIGKIDSLKWTIWIWLVALLLQSFLVYKYKKPKPFKCTVCGEVKVPNKLMWATMYNFPFDRMWCDNCCKRRHFVRIKEDDENNWDNPLKRQ
jgi:hypothetical protein